MTTKQAIRPPYLIAPVPSSSGGPTGGPTSGAPAGGCTATYHQDNAWQGGFQGSLTVRNTGTAAFDRLHRDRHREHSGSGEAGECGVLVNNVAAAGRPGPAGRGANNSAQDFRAHYNRYARKIVSVTGAGPPLAVTRREANPGPAGFITVASKVPSPHGVTVAGCQVAPSS